MRGCEYNSQLEKGSKTKYSLNYSDYSGIDTFKNNFKTLLPNFTPSENIRSNF